MNKLLLVLLLTLPASLVQGQTLRPVATEFQPRLEELSDVHDLGFVESYGGLNELRLWQTELVVESMDRSGELYISIALETEGAPAEVYKLPVEDVLSIDHFRWVWGTTTVEDSDGKSRVLSVQKRVVISFQTFDWETGGTLGKDLTIELEYGKHGNLIGLRVLK